MKTAPQRAVVAGPSLTEPGRELEARRAEPPASPALAASARTTSDPFADYHARVREHYRTLAPAYRQRANAVCDRRYHALVGALVRDRRRVLELGGGTSDLLDAVAPAGSVNCDLTPDTLRLRETSGRTWAVAGAGEQLPFRDGSFDGAYTINVLEHVADVDLTVAECARVLRRDALFLAITPNGDWERWLDLAERWRLKIPEGPHRFLTRARLHEAVSAWFEVIEQRPFLAFPSGPALLGAGLDRLTQAARLPWGFFQYVVARRG
jgi:SAM-dependent methyltransferase